MAQQGCGDILPPYLIDKTKKKKNILMYIITKLNKKIFPYNITINNNNKKKNRRLTPMGTPYIFCK